MGEGRGAASSSDSVRAGEWGFRLSCRGSSSGILYTGCIQVEGCGGGDQCYLCMEIRGATVLGRCSISSFLGNIVDGVPSLAV